MRLTNYYSRVAGNYDPDDRAWMISPEGKIYNCGFLHETCLIINRDLREVVGEDEGIYSLVRVGWGKVGYFEPHVSLEVSSLQDKVLRAYQEILSNLNLAPKSTVEIISSEGHPLFPYKDFRRFESVADVDRYIQYSQKQRA